MTKTVTEWITYLEAEPRSEPHLSIAAALREQATTIERLQRSVDQMSPPKPYIVLVGTAYEGAGWDDYAGNAETIEEAEALVQRKVAEQGFLCRESWFFHIVDLRTMKIVKRG